MAAANEDGPRVRVLPPLVYLVPLAAGLAISRWLPTHVAPLDLAHAVGAVLAIGGLAVGSSAFIRFRRAGTTVRPDRASSTLVAVGPYRVTRNPMYLGMAIVYVGIAVAAQSPWALLLLPLVLWVIRTRVIAPEEAFLRQRFGDAYLEYQARVRRWL